MNKSEDSLVKYIEKIPISELRKAYNSELEDWSYTNSEVKRIASEVLSKNDLDNPQGFVNVIEVVEMLVNKIKKLEEK